MENFIVKKYQIDEKKEQELKRLTVDVMVKENRI